MFVKKMFTKKNVNEKNVYKKNAYHPICYRLSNTPSTLKRISVHSGANVVVADLRSLTQDPASVRGERVRSVHQHLVGGLLQDGHAVGGGSDEGRHMNPAK